ncbi:hypothetical protein K1X76_07960 [bacterium]|nr:hypothetical protein [bacterium]
MINIYELIYIKKMELIKYLKADCEKYGRGRKAWWARELRVPALTVSHWLAGRQKPNGEYSVKIRDYLEIQKHETGLIRWQDYLWSVYYSKQVLPAELLGQVILNTLRIEFLDTRTLALLAVFVENVDFYFNEPLNIILKNRLGWLLESANKSPLFMPDRHHPSRHILALSRRSKNMEKTVKSYQTKLGKKWRVYDCELESIKKDLPWLLNLKT